MSTITTQANPLAPIIQREGLALAKAQAIVETLSPLVEEAGSVIRAVETFKPGEEPDASEIETAGKFRKALKSVRTRTETARVSLKEDALRTGKAIDACARWVKERIEPSETRMAEIEQFAARQEAERIETLRQVRSKQIAVYADPSFYKLGEMDEAEFQKLLGGVKRAHEDVLKAQAQAEQARKDEEARRAEEAQRLRDENQRLAAEAAKADQQRKEAEAAARKEREAAEAKARQEKAKADAKLKEEREAREAAEKVIREREAAEKKRLADEAKAAKKAAAAPDADKLMAYYTALCHVPKPECKTDEAKASMETIELALGSLLGTIKKAADSL